MSNFEVSIITPKGLFLKENVESLTIKLTSGYRTFLKGHMDLIGTLDYAPMHYVKNGKVYYFALHGGAINVKKNGIIVIASSIERKEDIDLVRAKEAKKRAEDRLNNKKDPNTDVKRAQIALLRANARIKTFEN